VGFLAELLLANATTATLPVGPAGLAGQYFEVVVELEHS
jgi:hypothetical protein